MSRVSVHLQSVRVPRSHAVGRAELAVAVEHHLAALLEAEPAATRGQWWSCSLPGGTVEVDADADADDVARSIARHVHRQLCDGGAL